MLNQSESCLFSQCLENGFNFALQDLSAVQTATASSKTFSAAVVRQGMRRLGHSGAQGSIDVGNRWISEGMRR